MYLQSFLIEILQNLRYAIPVERAYFPDEWKQKVRPTADDGGGVIARGGSAPARGCERPSPQGTAQGPSAQLRNFGQTQGYTGGGGHAQYGPGHHGGWWPPYLGGGYQGVHYPQGTYPLPTQIHPGGQQAPRDWRTGWNDGRNPKLKALMQRYLERTNRRVHLAEILAAAGKGQTDLPTLAK